MVNELTGRNLNETNTQNLKLHVWLYGLEISLFNIFARAFRKKCSNQVLFDVY